MTDQDQIDADRYRFGGFRYSLRAPDGYGPNEIIPEEESLYPYPRHEELEDESSSSSSES